MEINPELLDLKAIYKLITGIVIPRPIGWISSISENGVENLAPFSFFNAISHDPPHIVFCASTHPDSNQDTLNNILQTKQFVVNMVTEEVLEKMNLTSAAIPSHESEFDFAQLTPIASTLIKAPRVQESPIHLECELVHHYSIENHKEGGATLVVGKVVMFHINDEILNENYKLDSTKYQPISRLAGANYSKIGEVISIKRNLS